MFMIKAVKALFSNSTSYFEKSQAETSWEEALDEAINKINKLKDIESDEGKEKLGLILDELRLKQMSTQHIKDKFTGADATSGDVENAVQNKDQITIYYDLPWEGLPGHQARMLTKEVYALGVDDTSLLL